MTTERAIVWHKTGRVLGAYRFAYDEAGVATLEELHDAGWAPMPLANAGQGSGGGELDIETVQDTVASMFTAGGHENVVVTYDDDAGTIQLSAIGGSGGGLTQEQAEDIVAAMFGGSHSGATVAYDDALGRLTITVPPATGAQPLDATLTALSGLSGTSGLLEQTGPDLFTKRTIGVGTTTDIPTRGDADARYAATVHAHAQADVTGLDTSLAGKAPTVHTHAQADITGLATTLAGKTDVGHGHVIADTTGLQGALDTKAAVAHGHVIADTAGLQPALDLKAPLASPALTGTPTSPTPTGGDSSTKIATTAFVSGAITAGGGYTDEAAQDAVGNILTDSGRIDFTYNDAGPSITADIINSSITYGKIQSAAADRVLGTVGAGPVGEIVCTAAGRALLDDASASAQLATLGAAASSHSHAQSDVTNLPADLAARQPLDATLTALAGLNTTPGLVEQSGTDAFTKRAMGTAAATSVLTRGDGDARYATAVHAHAIADVTGLQGALDGKAATSHSHPQTDITNLVADLAAKAPLASPSLTGVPLAPTAAPGTATTQLATTAFVSGAITAGAFTAEAAQDAAAALLVDGTHTGISFSYDDAGAKLNATVSGGGAGGGAAPGDTGVWLGTTTRTLGGITGKLGEVASVLDYGAVGNGVAIDGPFIKAALLAHDNVFCPPGVYLFDIGQLLQLKGKRLFGVPGKTIFRHTSPHTDQVKNSFFYLGDCHPSFFDNRNAVGVKFKRFAVSGAVAKGQRVLTLSSTPTGGDATDLGAGKMVWVRHATEFPQSGWAQPDFAQLVRVESLSGATLTLEVSVNEALTSAIVSPIGTACSDGYLSAALGTAVVAGVCEDCVFENIIFEGGWEAFSRTGAYRCVLRNIEQRKSLVGLSLNAFTQGLIENYKVEYSLVFGEFKMACSDTIIKSFHGTYRPRPGIDLGGSISSDNNTLSIAYAIDIGERSNRLKFEDLRLRVGPEWTGAQRCLDVGDAWDITFERNAFDISGGGNAPILGIRGSVDTPTLFPTKGITYHNGSYRSGIAKVANALLQGYSTAPLTGIRYINNNWTGINTSTSIHINAAQYVDDWLAQDDVRNAFYVYANRALGALPARRTSYSMRF